MNVAAQTIRPAFEWGFLQTLARWSALAALAVGVVGAVLTRDVSFVVSFAEAAAIDVATLVAIVSAGHASLAGGSYESGRLPVLVGVRLAVKAVLLVLGAAVPALSFFGIVLGVLVVDTTVLVGGSIAAAVTTFGGPQGSPVDGEGPRTGE
jgi:hypothetical protein